MLKHLRTIAIGFILQSLLSIAAQAQVRAQDYDAFWLWGGVKPQAVLAQAKSLYILQGAVVSRGDDERNVRIVAQGVSIPHLRHGNVWLVYRADTLHWTPQVYEVMLARLVRWRQSGNPVIGIQIDFDAHTRHLQEYADFLRDLRSRLPTDCQLSITGLLDWSGGSSPDAINQLKEVVNEIIVQTYQGRHTITNYRDYLPSLSRLNLPFKVGLIQHGEWSQPVGLANNAWFRGYVVFLQNP